MKFFTVILTSFYSVLFVLSLQAQSDNLIPDPSAENLIECPEGLGGHPEDGWGIDRYVPDWISVRETPDYFNSCSVNPLSGWNNDMGSQIPRSGEGYLGAILFEPGIPDYREFFGTSFTEPLSVGEFYRVTFHVVMAIQERPAPSVGHETGMAANHLGFQLLTDQSFLAVSENNLPNQATFYLDTAITDTTNWIEISYEFIADSAYTTIVFGNFFDDAHTSISSPYIAEMTLAYYFFDDICITQVDNDCSYILSTPSEKMEDVGISLYPNPSASGFTVESDEVIERLIIYSIDGVPVITVTNVNSRSIQFDQKLEPGMYLVEIQRKRSKMTKKLMVQTKQQ